MLPCIVTTRRMALLYSGLWLAVCAGMAVQEGRSVKGCVFSAEKIPSIDFFKEE